MRLLCTSDLESYWNKVVPHERGHYGADAYSEARERVLNDWWRNRCHWWAAIADEESGTILSSASATLLAEESILEMCQSSDAGPKSLESYFLSLQAGDKSKPILYISSIIISSRHHSPFLFKSLSRDLKLAQIEWGFDFDKCICVAFNRKVRFLAERYGFKPVGLCRARFPVFIASREESPIIDALLG